MASPRENYELKHNIIQREDKTYQCSKCDKTFTYKQSYKQHHKTVHRTPIWKKPYQCSQCHKSFYYKSRLRIHILTHAGEKPQLPHQCSQCDEAFKFKENLVYHQRIHNLYFTGTGQGPHKCNQCDKVFSLYIDLVIHLRTHSDGKPFQCTQCDKSFGEKQKLVNHYKTHKTYTDNFNEHKLDVKEKQMDCDKAFVQNSGLIHQSAPGADWGLKFEGEFGEITSPRASSPGAYRPISLSKQPKMTINTAAQGENYPCPKWPDLPWSAHTIQEPHKCSQCDKSFILKSGLIKHLSTHTGQEPYKCSQCNKVFSQYIHLAIHRRTHSERKPFQCTKCEKSFGKKQRLLNHYASHKTYTDHFDEHKIIAIAKKKQEDCDKASIQNSGLIHQSIHPGQGPHKCSQCDKAFSLYIHLVIHLRTHSEGKPFQCTQCDKSFWEKQNLVNHYRTHKTDNNYFNEHKLEVKEEKIGSDKSDSDHCYEPIIEVKEEHIDVESNFEVNNKKISSEKSEGYNLIETKIEVKEEQLHCDKAFLQNSSIIHQSTLTELGPHRCSQCDKNFSLYIDLLIHLRTHSEGKSYQCNQCDKYFGEKQSLVNHYRTHRTDTDHFNEHKVEEQIGIDISDSDNLYEPKIEVKEEHIDVESNFEVNNEQINSEKSEGYNLVEAKIEVKEEQMDYYPVPISRLSYIY